jgi:acetamidase/formamidase
MIMGVGGSLDAAMRNATTTMSRWLTETYGLTQQDIAALLGTALHFQIAEVVDPEFHVVARISKAELAKIRK